MSFADTSFAGEYFADRAFVDNWNAASEKEKQQFLGTATKHIETFCTFYDDSGLPFVYTESGAPVWLKEACCEQALYLLNLGKDPTQADKKTTLGIRSTEGTTFDKSFSADILGVQCCAILERNGAVIDDTAINASGGISWGQIIK